MTVTQKRRWAVPLEVGAAAKLRHCLTTLSHDLLDSSAGSSSDDVLGVDSPVVAKQVALAALCDAKVGDIPRNLGNAIEDALMLGVHDIAESVSTRRLPVDCGLFVGELGTLWALLRPARFAHGDLLQMFRAISNASATSSDNSSTYLHFDLIGGLAGVLVGLTSAGRWLDEDSLGAPAAKTLLDLRAADGSWRTPQILTPTKRPLIAGDYYVDWGMAHGIVGATIALARWYCRVGMPVQAVEALDITSHLLLEQLERPASTHSWPLLSNPAGECDWGSPRGWCYGAAGTTVCLALAYEAAGRTESASAWAERAAWQLRLELEQLSGIEPGLCHGVAGLIVLTARMHHLAASPEFEVLVRQLTSAAIELGTFTSSVASTHGVGMLRGLSGIHLALTAVLSSSEPEWDCLLCLS